MLKLQTITIELFSQAVVGMNHPVISTCLKPESTNRYEDRKQNTLDGWYPFVTLGRFMKRSFYTLFAPKNQLDFCRQIG